MTIDDLRNQTCKNKEIRKARYDENTLTLVFTIIILQRDSCKVTLIDLYYYKRILYIV